VGREPAGLGVQQSAQIASMKSGAGGSPPSPRARESSRRCTPAARGWLLRFAWIRVELF
jgi:hypothetical protein